MNYISQIRKAAFAGSWYEQNEAKLRNELTKYLSQAKKELTDVKTLKAIIGPYKFHVQAFNKYLKYDNNIGMQDIDIADLLKHGATNISHQKKKSNSQFSNSYRIFLIGPSHKARFQGCGLSSCTDLDTPFGKIEVDRKVIEELQKTGSFDTTNKQIEEAEHSLEMHLPYIKNVMGDQKFQIVPIMVGSTTYEIEQNYGSILSKYFDDENTLFIISSDFCHWGERFNYTHYNPLHGKIHESIQQLDKAGMDAIESQNSKNFAKYLNETSNTICGRRGIGILLHIIEQSALKEKLKTKFVQYDQSSKVVNEEDSSVSYAAGVTYI